MSDISIQPSFNTGEWAPNLYARVDLQQYRSGAAMLENWYVDYRGGASTRPGTKYILHAFKTGTKARLIPFQASFNVGYCLEFGDGYIRFFYQGSPILENGLNIDGATQSNPLTLAVSSNTYSVGDWIFISGASGMTQINGQFYQIVVINGVSLTLADLNGRTIDSTSFGAFTGGGIVQRVYTISSPYAASELPLIKFAQNVGTMILCHPNHPPYVLSIIAATSWSLTPAVFGSTSSPPAGLGGNSTLNNNASGGTGGVVSYAYGVTSIDSNGQESQMSAPLYLNNLNDIRVTNGTNTISWNPVSGAFGYNVYEAELSYSGNPPLGAQYGFIGTTRATQFVDSNIAADFSQTPPIAVNPFIGSGVQYIYLTSNATYSIVPTVTLTGGSPSIAASAAATLSLNNIPNIAAGGTNYALGNIVVFPNGVRLQVTGIGTGGAVTSWAIINNGTVTTGGTPANPLSQVSTSGSGTGAQATATWGISAINVLSSGAGYTSPPAVTIPGGATANAVLGPTSAGNPTVPGFFQQRLVFAAPPGAPQTFYMSKPGTNFNFDISSPSQPDDSITGTLVSGVLNTIKFMVGATAGLLLLTDRSCWLVNGGGSGTAVSPSSIVANVQSFVGCADVPPIVAGNDILYIQSKGAAVRDLAFNIYFNTFASEDISVLSSHLFYNYAILEWAWAEQPFYVAWAVRNDGTMLSLTYLKEQQFKGWAHHITEGNFESVAAVTEVLPNGTTVDAVYTIVARTINGTLYRFIERFAERSFPNGVVDAWCVDAGLQYVGAPTASFVGAQHLAGLAVTGLADGVPIGQFIMPANGQFTLIAPASKVTIGLSYVCKLKSLPLQLDGGEAVQGKLKKNPHVDVRVNETLGLKIGSDFNHLVLMKDLIRGGVSSMLSGLSSQVVTDLVFGDARTFLDPSYSVFGQFCIQQDQPYPSTVLGLFPSYVIGDDR